MNESQVFANALNLADADERRAYLDAACAGDPELRAAVEALLQARDSDPDFLEHTVGTADLSAAGSTTLTVDAPGSEKPGTVLAGRYRLVEPVGAGGMGAVWMANQTDPVKRLVAVKLIKPGMDSKTILARFEAERQALALMDHPNIAKVFDAGTTPDGRPFFAMELVKGVSITRYCDDHRLTPRDRLELFVPVCQAVQHAHQKGIIHRDLKPANVLVARYDDRPVPKVIDFGVAKAAGVPLTEDTLHTGFGAVVGTPEYMSPEQASFNQLDIDTRSDIYSLGVLLYELLAGSPPFSKKELELVGALEMLRVIREQEPARPSAKLSTADGLPTLAANRGTEPGKLTKLVRGELDWIVMKALEKDRARRYDTAAGLAADIQRYLADEPVAAGPPGASYRLRKFVGRNRRMLAAGVAFVSVLVAAVLSLSVALVAVTRERRDKEAALEAEGKRRKQARAALDAMSSRLIEDWLARQSVLLPEHRQFLEQMLHQYEEFAADTGQDEESRAGVAQAYRRVSAIRRRLGQRADARAAAETSRDLYARLAADFPGAHAYRADLAAAYLSLSALSGDRGQELEALAVLDQGLRLYRELVADAPDVPEYRRALSRALTARGILLKNLNRRREAEDSYREALTIQQRLADESPAHEMYREELAQTYLNLGLLHLIDNRLPEAEQAGGRAVELYVRLSADNPSSHRHREWLAASRNNLGDVIRIAGRLPEAEQVFRESLVDRRWLVAEFPGVPEYWRGLAMTLNNLGIVLKDTNRAPEAEDLYRQSLAIHRRLAADYPAVMNHRNEVAGAMANLARVLLARGESQAAHELLVEAVPHHQAVLAVSPNNPAYRRFYRINRWRMAEVLLARNDHAGAAAATRELVQIGFEPPRDAYTAAGLFAGCARLAAADDRLAEPRRKELASTYADSAVAALRQAIDQGAKEVSKMPTDSGLDPLRHRPDFQELQAGVEARKKP